MLRLTFKSLTDLFCQKLHQIAFYVYFMLLVVFLVFDICICFGGGLEK